MHNKKRPLTKAGSIVDIVIASITVVVSFYTIIMLASVMSVASSMTELAAMLTELLSTTITAETARLMFTVMILAYVAEILFDVVIIILGAFTCARSNWTVENYANKKGVQISLVVFNFIMVLFGFISCISNAMSIIPLLVYVMCAVFVLVDLCRNQKDFKTYSDPNYVEPTPTQPQPWRHQPEPKEPNLNEVYKTLSDLKTLLDNQVITQQEYDEMKRKIIDKQ